VVSGVEEVRSETVAFIEEAFLASAFSLGFGPFAVTAYVNRQNIIKGNSPLDLMIYF
jgi:hypothetical protein